MEFVPFAMERWQSTYEHEVELNLSESGVHPLTVGELLDLAGREADAVGEVLLEYSPSNGTAALRERIAALHPGAGVDDVLVTTGSAEANFLSCWRLLRPGDEVVFLAPSYFQVAGLARNLGARVADWWLREDRGWAPDVEELDELVSERTRLIVVTHPNNPTGAIGGEDLFARTVEAAARVGAWILADEVYRGAEREGDTTPTFWGRYDRTIVTGGLSKAYGLPGLRLGWAVAPAAMCADLWARKDYTSISVSAPSQALGRLALDDAVRPRLLQRTRSILRRNWPLLEGWLRARRDAFDWVPPRAGAIALVRYELPIEAGALAERLRVEGDCLLVPGTHFDLPSHLRIGYGPESERLEEGLARLAAVVDPLRAGSGMATETA